MYTNREEEEIKQLWAKRQEIKDRIAKEVGVKQKHDDETHSVTAADQQAEALKILQAKRLELKEKVEKLKESSSSPAATEEKEKGEEKDIKDIDAEAKRLLERRTKMKETLAKEKEQLLAMEKKENGSSSPTPPQVSALKYTATDMAIPPTALERPSPARGKVVVTTTTTTTTYSGPTSKVVAATTNSSSSSSTTAASNSNNNPAPAAAATVAPSLPLLTPTTSSKRQCADVVKARNGAHFDIYLSLRFADSYEVAVLLKERLKREGVEAFLCDVPVSEDIRSTVMDALSHCKMAVIIAGSTYGFQNTSTFSTSEEMEYIIAKKKPFFLMKSCEQYEVEQTKKNFAGVKPDCVLLVSDPRHPHVPLILTSEIIAKLKKVNTFF